MRVINTNSRGAALGSTTKVTSGQDMAFPATVTLTSADGTRKIELSTDGINFFQPTYDTTAAAFIAVAVLSPVRAIKFTGLTTDTYTIL